MSCFERQMGLEDGYFRSVHQHKPPGNNLKFLKYPTMDVQPDARTPRLYAHTDWGSLTMVFTSSPGLEVRHPKDHSWVHAPVVPNGIVVNVGDALALWTGNRLKSTLHRITWESVSIHSDRYSIVYFVNPNAGMFFCLT